MRKEVGNDMHLIDPLHKYQPPLLPPLSICEETIDRAVHVACVHPVSSEKANLFVLATDLLHLRISF